ncbi:hypothetical protein BN7_3479 [Wickerhamomyces ciferrii]|uniref:SCP domain-containing protein n=1 Tax=Wickerhamomyces ciferrii (strain ATCC 14091 / BCRC 22168 / CBS 111 / JCM 3599 / NBRC 0793 / NRRL Y-1031 F-60-10) TaxID=1206466 RepID=K0KRJ9_WICCF|nr:uncharacterized protein BN7_3479 [Wickerhamomyces ciferrii]CCH43924.1 hypothetical protein BN7_3479 [Wickerhamomyces ciferrii]
MAIADLVTITNIHTVQEIKTQYATTLITEWTTINHSDDPMNNLLPDGTEDITTTLTSTRTTTLTTTTTSSTETQDKKRPITSASSSSTAKPSSSSSPSSSSTQSSTSTSSSSSSSSTLSFPSEVVQLHNDKRSKHSATPLKWDQKLTDVATSYANQYNCNGTLIHSTFEYGENLAIGYNTSAAIEAWYDEVQKYNFNNPGFSEATGHFTQLVWNSTTKVGCAVKDCGDYFGEYLVCEYDPAGNIQGQYDDNVFAG